MSAMTSQIVLGEKYGEGAKFDETLVIRNLGEGYRGEGCFLVLVLGFFLVLFLQVFLKMEIITKELTTLKESTH